MRDTSCRRLRKPSSATSLPLKRASFAFPLSFCLAIRFWRYTLRSEIKVWYSIFALRSLLARISFSWLLNPLLKIWQTRHPNFAKSFLVFCGTSSSCASRCIYLYTRKSQCTIRINIYEAESRRRQCHTRPRYETLQGMGVAPSCSKSRLARCSLPVSSPALSPSHLPWSHRTLLLVRYQRQVVVDRAAVDPSGEERKLTLPSFCLR